MSAEDTLLHQIVKLTFPEGYAKDAPMEVECNHTISIKRHLAEDGTVTITLYNVTDK